jgi:hypothetical protein
MSKNGAERRERVITEGADLRRSAGKAENVALAGMANGRSPATRHWFPLDPSLPALAEPLERLRASIAQAGVDVGEIWDRPQILAYRPRHRAVVRVGDHVLKFYSTDRAFETAVRGLRISSGLRSVRTPSMEAVSARLRLTVQSALPGRAPEDPTDVARSAGALLRRLHGSGPFELPHFAPRAQLRAAAATCGLWAHTQREQRRVRGLLRDLEGRMPREGALVPSHGDFNSNQILEHDGELALVDFDRMCAASPALDLANYAARMMICRTSNVATAREALELLLDGYGWRFENMSWYIATAILRRAHVPCRGQADSPMRVERIVHAVESALAA